MNKKAERRNLGKEIRRVTGLPLPVAQRLAKGVLRSGASGFHYDHKKSESGSTVRRAADSILIQSGDWQISAIFAEGKRGRYYFEGKPLEKKDSP
jgi:hypothetical protein